MRVLLEQRARAVWEEQQAASKLAAEAKAETVMQKPNFQSSTSAELSSVKQRLSSDPEFKQKVTAWDNRRKRIEARLASCDGTEGLSALRTWFKHMQKNEERIAVLTLW